ncbi:hypothetical protein, partial [Klebsiella pneumoniae]|uniref:hypothetical protein n=1 Tax=Klebsiella pneumoniae TaxID=573 RepID=UPI00224BAA35
RVQARPAPSALETAPVKKEAYRWKATTPVVQTKEVVATPKALKKALEHEKTPELAYLRRPRIALNRFRRQFSRQLR